MKRRSELEALVLALVKSLPSVQAGEVLVDLNRDRPFDKGLLPAINIARLGDPIGQQVPASEGVALNRTLQLGIDLYASGSERFVPLDEIEEELVQCLAGLGFMGLGGGETVEFDSPEFDLETELAPLCSTRIPVSIRYTVTL
jgi:hypothetical protein